MSSKATDIAQLKKYLNGELDNLAMHRLERQSIDDPFLADALEGYQANTANLDLALNNLKDRLQRRTDGAPKRIIAWNWLAVAALLISVLTIGGFWFFKQEHAPVKKTQMAAVPEPEKKQPVSTQTDTTAQKVTQADALVSKPTVIKQGKKIKKKLADSTLLANTSIAKPNAIVAAASPVTIAANKTKTAADTVPLNDVVVIGYTTAKKDIQADKVVELKSNLKVPTEPDKSLNNGQALGLNFTKSASPQFSLKTVPPRTITGVVTDKTDGQPIIGAYVRVEGRNSGTVTDASGHFNLPQINGKETLAVNFIGYNSSKIAVKNKDSINVSLEPTGNALNEVVVVPGASVKTENVAAHPQQDWSAFKKYLSDKATSADRAKGVVKLSFIVGVNGRLSEFKVIKGLSDAANQKAIELIQNGPTWTGNTNGKPEEVKVKIAFK